MIHSIKCDKPSFKTIHLKKGFNVILAERTKESAKKDSRNGLGKSTLIEIIHFCLGGKKGETLTKPQVEDWTFTIEIDLGGKKYSISRNIAEPKNVFIEGDCSDWPIQPNVDKNTNRQILSQNDWTRNLGVLMFDIQPTYEGKFHPTFRSMISYFIRKNGQSGAFLNPFQQYKSQAEWDIQVNNTCLLGLGWQYASKWQVLKDREKVISQIKQEVSSGFISNLMGNIGELDAHKIRLEAQAKQEKEQLDNFKVHPQYNQIEDDANRLTKAIHLLVNSNIDDKRLLEYYEASLKEEIDTKPEQVAKVYGEAGLVFSDSVTKKIDEVLNFHKKIVINRKEFLSSEIDRLKQNIVRREQEIQGHSTKRAELMLTLRTHGALQEYVHLQTNHQNTVSQLKDVSLKLENLKKFEQGKSALVIEQALLQQSATKDLNDRYIQKQEAILTFNSYSQHLYKVPGTLSINVEKKGYSFKVDIQRSGSYGVGNMKIFCYDLLLAKLWAKRSKTPIFLIHDSIIFADVDERQKALALQLAESEARKEKYQYICTMNSDTVPRGEFDKDFEFDSFVVATFTDAKEDGGLLGIRF
jgi:uncharacterized protein YydD (DUF2326 family)